MMTVLCGMVDRRKALSHISSQDINSGCYHCKPSTRREQNLNLIVNGLFLQHKKCLKTPVYEVILLYIPFITLFSVLTMWLPGYFPYFF